jgi:hypothetical protein
MYLDYNGSYGPKMVSSKRWDFRWSGLLAGIYIPQVMHQKREISKAGKHIASFLLWFIPLFSLLSPKVVRYRYCQSAKAPEYPWQDVPEEKVHSRPSK